MGLVCLFALRPYLQRFVTRRYGMFSKPVFYLQKPVMLGFGMLILPASLPTQACRARVWHVYSHCIPTFRGLLCCGPACLFTLHAYLQWPVAPGSSMLMCPASLPREACRAGVRHVYSPCILTYRGVSSQGLACFVALCPTYKGM